MSRMETTDIVIHKGEKEEKYQLYVEDYVMSFLKNYGTSNGRKIFFYGTREQKNKKYYIYGAGQQKNISYFVRYELLDEIVCRFDMDKPVFSIKEDSGRYELSGYYIFYQSNEAMQSYMIEQRKGHETEEKSQDKFRTQGRSQAQNGLRAQEKSGAQNKIRPQDFSDIRTRSGLKSSDVEKGNSNEKQINTRQTYVHNKKEEPEKSKGGVMAFQLTAVFLVLAAIIINSTNSYSKLRELGQSAVEVFFTMENQEAAKNDDGKMSGETEISEVTRETEMSETQGGSDLSGESETSDVADGTQGTVLRLEDLDAEFEKENQEAKDDADNTSEVEDASDMDKEEKDSDSESAQGKGNVVDEAVQTKEDAVGENAQLKENADFESEQEKNSTASTEEPPSQEAFARNFAEYYQIEKGDTLCKISIKLYGDASKVNEICEINKIDDPDNIKYGQKILLP
ncbi:MAG: LysM peptidoglycan-binding domain-containing protein [Lachnospiraceae bacterium]|nr:LysM peptidoglycan-binding domain-containing protein [Lachnospiraceae bacterium]